MINHENRRKIIIIIISIVVAVVLVSIAISELRSYQERIELGEHEYQELLNDITNFHFQSSPLRIKVYKAVPYCERFENGKVPLSVCLFLKGGIFYTPHNFRSL